MAPVGSPRANGRAPPHDVAAEALSKVQAYAFPRRTRTKDSFTFFDRLRCGRVTRAQFVRGLGGIGLQLSEPEALALADRYTNPEVQGSQNVNYDQFCEDVDKVFSSSQPVQRNALVSNAAQALLSRLAMLCAKSSVSFRALFAASPPSSPQRTPRAVRELAGKVPVAHFRRGLRALPDVTAEEVNLLLSCYAASDGSVDVEQIQSEMDLVALRGTAFLRRGTQSGYSTNVVWSQQRLGAIEKIRAKIVEKRVRLCEYFHDFDVLRRGVCTIGQLKTVFTILSLDKEIEQGDVESIVNLYCRDDKMFNYVDFCADADCVFTMSGLEKDPDLHCRMPDAETTAPARRNRQHLSAAMLHKLAALEERIRQKIQSRRIDMKPAFSDMDRVRTGHVSRKNMERVLSFFGIALDEPSIDILCAVYCDRGNHNDFNYMDFCARCEFTDHVGGQPAHQLTASPRVKTPQRYFDAHGYIRPVALMRCGAVA